MASSPLLRRCPTCGEAVAVVLAPGPPTQWFPCPHCRTPFPVVVPRDPPPLYSWEVVPGLYPPLPRPRVPRWNPRRAAVAALVGVVLLTLVFASAFVYLGLAAGSSGTFAVSGTVYRSLGSGVVPAAGATVVLTKDSGGQLETTTLADGSFAFSGVPSGGVAINISLPAYVPVIVSTFVSSVYDAGTTGLTVTLTPGPSGTPTAISLSPFANLESFLASVGVAAVLFAAVAAVAAAAAWGTRRQDRPALGVVGGAAGLLAPTVLYLLEIGTAFPLLTAATAAVAGFGAFALALRTVELARTSPALGSG